MNAPKLSSRMQRYRTNHRLIFLISAKEGMWTRRPLLCVFRQRLTSASTACGTAVWTANGVQSAKVGKGHPPRGSVSCVPTHKSTTVRLNAVRSLKCSTCTKLLSSSYLQTDCRLYPKTVWIRRLKLTNCRTRCLPCPCSTKVLKILMQVVTTKLDSGSRPTTRTAKWAKWSSNWAKSVCWTTPLRWRRRSSTRTRSGSCQPWVTSNYTSVKMTGTSGNSSATPSTPINAY